MQLRFMSIVVRLAVVVVSLFLHGAQAIPPNVLSLSVGYHVIYSYPGITPPRHLSDLIAQGKVGGIIIFGENVDNSLPERIKAFQDTYRKSSAYAGSPLLILTDQEGGLIRRLPGGPTLSEKRIGNSSNPASAAATAGKQAAAALAAYNHNGNLAPVCDVFHSPGDFDDQYQRSYSNDSSIAALCTSAFVKSQQGAKIAATAKHFPGLGAASKSENTDLGPVTINSSLASIRAVDEVPFKAAIKAGVDMIMTSWAIYPALDPKFPAGLSAKWVQGELRGRLGFKGVTITDALEAGSLTPFGSDPGHRAILASQAGMDIILAAQRNVTQGEVAFNALEAAIRSGSLDWGSFQQASQRILKLRRSLK